MLRKKSAVYVALTFALAVGGNAMFLSGCSDTADSVSSKPGPTYHRTLSYYYNGDDYTGEYSFRVDGGFWYMEPPVPYHGNLTGWLRLNSELLLKSPYSATDDARTAIVSRGDSLGLEVGAVSLGTTWFAVWVGPRDTHLSEAAPFVEILDYYLSRDETFAMVIPTSLEEIDLVVPY